MKKRLFGILSVLLALLVCGACDSDDKAVTIETTPTVAVEATSDASLAAADYCTEKGYKIIECGSEEDAAVLVENGKYDFAVIDEFTDIVPEDVGLEFVETCKYTVKYRLGFSNDNTELLDQFNEAIISLKRDGTIKTLIDNNKNGIPNDIPESSGNELRILCYGYIDDRVYFDEKGTVQGIDADIIRCLCYETGYTPVFISAEYDELFSMLDNGEGDVLLMIDDYIGEDVPEWQLSEVYLEKTFNVYRRSEK